MASGFEMMLRAMGIDPEEMKKSLIAARDELVSKMASIDAKLELIDKKLNVLLQCYNQDEDGRTLHDAGYNRSSGDSITGN